MPGVNICPDREVLRQHLSGRLSEPEALHVDEHLQQCSSCVAALAPLLPAVRAELPRLVSAEPTPFPVELILRIQQFLLQPAEPPAPPLPAALGRYRLQTLLGRGGMGVVYQAHDPELDRLVAIKVPLFTGPPERQSLARQRFLREARAAVQVRHPHICTIYDVGEHDSQPFVVMELVRGGSLAEYLHTHERFADCRAAVRLILQVADALDAVHSRGILHRDLKPGNILLDEAGRPLLADFGLARTDQHVEPLTAEGVVLGTPAYMAPEQASPQLGPVTAQSDLYSLGVVLYQMLTGRVPFQGDTQALLHQAAEATPPSPVQVRPDLDPALAALVVRALARQPADRFADVREFAAALRSWLEKGHSKPRRRLVVAAAFGLTLLALAVVGWLVLHSSQPGGPPQAAVPVKGLLDITVWDPPDARGKRNPDRQGLRLHQLGALPLKVKDQVRVEVELNRPLFVYLIWISSAGRALPVYPWQKQQWDQRPAEEHPVTRLSLPDTADDDGWEMDEGLPGMETLLLLASETELPRQVDLARLLAGLPAQTMQQRDAAVWFENGEVVRDEQNRAPKLDPTRIDDPVLRTQRLLKEKLQPLCSYTRAVSFAFTGR